MFWCCVLRVRKGFISYEFCMHTSFRYFSYLGRIYGNRICIRVKSCLSVQEIKMLLVSEPDVTIKLWFKTGIRSWIRFRALRILCCHLDIRTSGNKRQMLQGTRMHARFTQTGFYKMLSMTESEALRNFVCCLDKNMSLSMHVIWLNNCMTLIGRLQSSFSCTFWDLLSEL